MMLSVDLRVYIYSCLHPCLPRCVPVCRCGCGLWAFSSSITNTFSSKTYSAAAKLSHTGVSPVRFPSTSIHMHRGEETPWSAWLSCRKTSAPRTLHGNQCRARQAAQRLTSDAGVCVCVCVCVCTTTCNLMKLYSRLHLVSSCFAGSEVCKQHLRLHVIYNPYK